MWKANLACIITLSNLLCGFFAIMLQIFRMPYWALFALICAFICDGLDGAVARRSNMTSAFGERLDSLSDLVSFGMAPVFLATAVRPDWEIGLTCAAGLFLVCGAVRLARYDPSKQVLFFRGMPIPIAGLLLSSFAITSGWVHWFDFVPGILGLLMVSDLPFRKVRFQGSDALMPFVLGSFAVFVLVVSHDLAIATLGFTVPYVVLNLLYVLGRDLSGRYRAMVAARSMAD